MIELMVWAPSLKTITDGMAKYGFGSYVTDAENNTVFQPVPEAQIDVIGDIITSPAVYDNNNQLITPAVTTGGCHVNLRGWGSLEQMMTAGIPQYNDQGVLLPLFERTRILTFIPGITYTPIPITNSSLVGGYAGPDGVLLFDPGLIKHRRRVWA